MLGDSKINFGKLSREVTIASNCESLLKKNMKEYALG